MCMWEKIGMVVRHSHYTLACVMEKHCYFLTWKSSTGVQVFCATQHTYVRNWPVTVTIMKFFIIFYYFWEDFGTIVTKATELSPSLDHLLSMCCVHNAERSGSRVNVLFCGDTWTRFYNCEIQGAQSTRFVYLHSVTENVRPQWDKNVFMGQ